MSLAALRALVREATGPAGGRAFPWALAATAWAVAEVLQQDRTLRMLGDLRRFLPEPDDDHGWPPAEAWDVADWHDAAVAAGEARDGDALFRALLRVLAALDLRAGLDHAVVGVAPREVDVALDPPRRVRVWMRGPGALGRLKRAMWARAPRVNQYPAAIAQRLVHLCLVDDAGSALPVRPVTLRPSHPGLVGWPTLLRERCVVALCPLTDRCRTRFRAGYGPERRCFRADLDRPLTDPDALLAHLDRLGRRLADEDVAIAVLPELTLPPGAARDAVDAWFDRAPRLRLVAAGSFHVARDAEDPHNELPVLDGEAAAWTHSKRGFFRVPASLAAKLGETFHVPDDVAHDDYLEGIEPGRELRVLDADLGRIAAVLCADVLEPDRMLRAVLDVARPDLLLLPSMTTDLAPFHRFAREAWDRGVGTLWVNARGTAGPTEDHAFVCLPFPDLPGFPPAWVRWTPGGLLAWEPRRDAWVQCWGAAHGRLDDDALLVDLAAWWRGPVPPPA